MRFAAYISSFMLVVAAALSTSSFHLFTMRKKASSFLFLSSLSLSFLSSSFANGETLQCFAHPDTGETTCTEGGQVLNDDSLEDQQQGNESRNNNNEDPNCKDHHEMCSFWAKKGECKKNPNYMRSNCQISCNTCKNKKQTNVKTKRTSKLSSRDSKLLEGTTEFGEKQEASGDKFEATMDVIEKSTLYMSRDLKDLPPKVIEQCKNRHKLCAFWAAIGECEANISYMTTNCAPSCLSCHLIDFDTRCPKREDENDTGVYAVGELNQMFERLVEENESGEKNYTLTVHSKPKGEKDEDNNIQDGPWVVTFDNFLSDEECQHLIKKGYDTGYERSKDVGKQKFDGSFDSYENTRRTSENAWCSDKKENDCRNDPTVTVIRERMAKAIQVPSMNFEDFQILRYEKGQYYKQHHDYIPHQRDRPCGPRILTFFLYLSDVEHGGGTAFPLMGNLTVTPKRGRALLWPSVLDEQPLNKDRRTEHEALPVFEGTKFAANAWIHSFDYVTAQKVGCN